MSRQGAPGHYLPAKYRRLEVFLEFLLYGLVVGMVEDLIAVKLVSDEPITWQVVGVVAAVAVPFAFLGEVIIDRKIFLPRFVRRKAHRSMHKK